MKIAFGPDQECRIVDSQAVRQRSAKPRHPSSILGRASRCVAQKRLRRMQPSRGKGLRNPLHRLVVMNSDIYDLSLRGSRTRLSRLASQLTVLTPCVPVKRASFALIERPAHSVRSISAGANVNGKSRYSVYWTGQSPWLPLIFLPAKSA